MKLRLERFPATAPRRSSSERNAPLRLLSWNLGYAGLGAESDFKADGGSMLRPPSKAAVEKNLAGIQATLRDNPAELYLLQELARPGPLTRGVDVIGGVREALPDCDLAYSSNVWSRFIPWPLKADHGMGTASAIAVERQSAHPLPNEPDPLTGILFRRYHLQISEFVWDGRPWTAMNVHLSAFDEGSDLRKSQLNEALSVARRHYERGRHVILSGDWNLRLTPTDFEHDSEESALFWIYDFPQDSLPDGWALHCDEGVPTVRTNERPFQIDRNYRTIIDGLIVSPNVRVETIRTLDLGFQYSDHQPIISTLRSGS